MLNIQSSHIWLIELVTIITLATCGPSTPAVAQECYEWVLVSEIGPSGRTGQAMCYDEMRGVTLLFGGRSGETYLGDTWQWDGFEWSLVAQSGPSPRYAHTMAYDSQRGVVVLFGGQDSSGCKSDTWEWDGARWAQRDSMTSHGCYNHAMCFDRHFGETVRFGGTNQGRGTWVWDWRGRVWTPLTNEGPLSDTGHAMAYDIDRGVSTLFGGYNYGGPPYLGETWEWNGAEWALVATRGPSARYLHTMAYMANESKTLLYGGKGRNGSFSDTWLWDGLEWSLLDIPASGSPFSSAAYDSNRGVVVLFGGTTWEFSCAENRLSLTTTSSCPEGGPISISWSNASPGGRVALVFARDTGSFLIPANYPCQGTQLGLGTNQVQLVGDYPAGATGERTINGFAGNGACGGYLQLLDLTTCDTSNVARIE